MSRTRISIAEVKRRLPVGTVFEAEFIGRNALSTSVPIRRRVVKQASSQMISEILEGGNAGKNVYLNWNHTSASEADGSIYLADGPAPASEEFVRIKILNSPEA